MSLEVAALIGCAASLALAVLRCNQVAMLVAITAYAAVIGWIIRDDLTLLMPALGLAIALAVLGLVVLSQNMRQDAPPERHRRHGGAAKSGS